MGHADEGTFEKGVPTRERNYAWRMDTFKEDAPTYAEVTERWAADGTDRDLTQSATTRYLVVTETPDQVHRTEVTYPNGTLSVQRFYDTRKQIGGKPVFPHGLPSANETYDADGKLLQVATTEWERGAHGAPRLTRSMLSDELNQTTSVGYTYRDDVNEKARRNQVTDVRTYDYSGQVVCRVHTDYLSDDRYDQRHIFDLARMVETYGGESNLLARTEFSYDQQGSNLEEAPGVVQHSLAHDPYAPRVWVPGGPSGCEPTRDKLPCSATAEGHWDSVYDPATDLRGNLTGVTKYVLNDASQPSSSVTETRRYDITGNLRATSRSEGEEHRFVYTRATQYAYPTIQLAGAPYSGSPRDRDDACKSGVPGATARLCTSSTYDIGTSLVLSMTEANGLTTWTEYGASSLRPLVTHMPTTATVEYDYDDATLAVTSTTREAPGYPQGAIAAQDTVRLDGRAASRMAQVIEALVFGLITSKRC